MTSELEEIRIQKWSDEPGLLGWKYKGHMLPKLIKDPVDRLQFLADIKYKHGDVVICSYPKCGLHWLSEMLTRVLREDANTVGEFLPLVDMTSTPEKIVQAPEPRIIATHLTYKFLPKEHVDKKGKIILLLRNPKDVAVSLFNFMQNLRMVKSKVPWEHFIDFFMKGEVFFSDYFDYINDFEKRIAENPQEILPVFYEDLKEDCVNQLKRIADFLGLTRSEAFLQNVAKNCQFNTLKSDKEANPAFKDLLTDKGNLIVYRKGEVGDWKNWLTVGQNERMDAVIKNRLKDSSFTFRYSKPETE